MSRSHWAVLLAAVFGIFAGMGKFEPRNSSSELEEAGVRSTAGGVCGNIVRVSYQDKLQELVTSNSPSKVEGARDDIVVKRTAALAPAEGVFASNTSRVHATTSALSVALRDLPVGKAIRVGELQFVKVHDNQYLTADKACIDELAVGGVKNFDYTGNVQTFQTCPGHTYKLEVWGAQGGGNDVACGDWYANASPSGKGGYSVGELKTASSVLLNVYVGQRGCCGSYPAATFGGGGAGCQGTSGDPSCTGGGATDVRVGNTSLYSRIIVAGGGAGGGDDTSECGGHGGGANSTGGGSYTGTSGCGQGNGYCNASTQIGAGTCPVNWSGAVGYYTLGSFGAGGGNKCNDKTAGFASGGGGWYGGSGAQATSAAGGSGWIYTASTYEYWKNNSTEGKSGNWLLDSTYYLTNASTVVGNASMPNPRGSGNITGNTGHGYARITRLN